MEDADEDVGATGEFGVAVRQKSVADDQPKGQRERTRRRGKGSDG